MECSRTKRSAMSCLMANQLTPPRCPPLSLRVCPAPTIHPSLPAPISTYHPTATLPISVSTSHHSPPCTPAHATRTLPHTPHNGPQREQQLPLPPPPSPTRPQHAPSHLHAPTLPAHNSTLRIHPTEEAAYCTLFLPSPAPGSALPPPCCGPLSSHCSESCHPLLTSSQSTLNPPQSLGMNLSG